MQTKVDGVFNYGFCFNSKKSKQFAHLLSTLFPLQTINRKYKT